MAEQPGTEVALSRLYLPEEIAAVLGCSAWWVKDRARRRLIPFTRVGRAYRFTAEHLAEIIRLHEERPARASQPSTARAAAKTHGQQANAPQRPQLAAPTTRLRARSPSRVRQSQFNTVA
ncbi:helix-turn-helix domain-containing protein [Streptomyces sp. NPDC058092]|uniref:helix-turn-helix domain-containing protein n=1 Tax=Streptomyces sp. NPDC058092 TaxID=3346336 RepID=UPI0036E9FE78